MSDVDNFEFEGQQVSLLDLGEIDTGRLVEYRGFTFPKGMFDWEIKDFEMVGIETDRGPKPLLKVKCECVNVHQADIKDIPLNDASELIGRAYEEAFFISEIERDLGRFKAFINDMGVSKTFKLAEGKETLEGHRFTAGVTHRPNKNNPDNPYTGMTKVKPLA
jgi:hypothetical protein